MLNTDLIENLYNKVRYCIIALFAIFVQDFLISLSLFLNLSTFLYLQLVEETTMYIYRSKT